MLDKPFLLRAKGVEQKGDQGGFAGAVHRKDHPWSDETSGSKERLSWSAMGKLPCWRMFSPAQISPANIRVILNMVVLLGTGLFFAPVDNVPEGLEGVEHAFAHRSLVGRCGAVLHDTVMLFKGQDVPGFSHMPHHLFNEFPPGIAGRPADLADIWIVFGHLPDALGQGDDLGMKAVCVCIVRARVIVRFRT